MKLDKKRGVATNSVILAFVQCLTIVTSVLQTMILSRKLSKTEYGTYGQGMLVVNFLLPFLLLGLGNAITYFSGQKDIDKHKYINTIVTMVVFTGVLGGIGIIAFRSLIEAYFGNPMLKDVLLIIAPLPLLLNMISIYQTLFVAENMAFSVAIRNAIVAVCQIIIVAIGVYLVKSIHFIFILLVVMDVIQIIIFASVFRKKKYRIAIQKIEKDITSQIFKYSIPLAFSTAIGTLSIYLDKLVIGKLMTVEDFALYNNMSKELPFAFVVSSFTTVIMPAFIKMHADNDNSRLKKYWGKYLELGMYVTWIMSGVAIFCSDDLLVFLYSEKYIQGLSIFIVYLLVTFCRFSYFGIILSTFGKTKIIMYSSLMSLTLNLVLNILFFYLFGMIGPAIASLLSIFLMEILQICYSCKLLECKAKEVFSFGNIALLLFEIAIVGIIVRFIGIHLIKYSFLRLLVCGVFAGGILLLLNYKKLMGLVREINSL